MPENPGRTPASTPLTRHLAGRDHPPSWRKNVSACRWQYNLESRSQGCGEVTHGGEDPTHAMHHGSGDVMDVRISTRSIIAPNAGCGTVRA